MKDILECNLKDIKTKKEFIETLALFLRFEENLEEVKNKPLPDIQQVLENFHIASFKRKTYFGKDFRKFIDKINENHPDIQAYLKIEEKQKYFRELYSFWIEKRKEYFNG